VTKNIDSDFVYKESVYKDGEKETASYKTYAMVEGKYSDAKTTPHELEITGKGKKTEVTFDVGKAIKKQL
jgi:hypothetical protein